MPAEKESTRPIQATPMHLFIAIVVVFIFLMPFILKLFFPESKLSHLMTGGLRVMWFYLISYSSLIGVAFWVDHHRLKKNNRQESK